MKLMIITYTMNRGGAEKMAAHLANQISAMEKHSVFLLVYGASQSLYPLHSGISYINMNASSRELRLRFPLIRKIRKIIKENHIDVVFGFSAGISEILPIAVLGLSCRAIGTERSNPYFHSHGAVRRFITNLAFSMLDGVVFTTKGCRDYYSESVRRKSVIIPNGYVETCAHKELSADRIHCKDIIAIGNLRQVKDYPTMIRAFSIFANTHSDYCLHIYGEGIEENAIRRLLGSYGLENRIILHGSVNDLTEVYKSCKFLVHSSKSESWCNAILEALSFGVPCIAADCDFGPREMIRHGFNGLLYEVGNVRQLADYMSVLAEDSAMLNEMSKNARQDVQKFEFDNILKQYYR